VLLLSALEGNGVALIASYVAQPALRSGALVQVLEEFPIAERWIKALVPERRMALARVRVLITFLEQALGPVAIWEQAPGEKLSSTQRLPSLSNMALPPARYPPPSNLSGTTQALGAKLRYGTNGTGRIVLPCAIG
jgi:hypothetical protein